MIALLPENIVGDEVECVVLNRNNLKKLDHVGALDGLIAVFVVKLHVLGVRSILLGPTDRGDINRPEIAFLSCIGINVAHVPAGVTVIVPVEDEVYTILVKQGFPLLTPIFENPPSLYRFWSVTLFVKSLNIATV